MGKVGRPSKYDPKFCEELITFYDVEPYTDVDIPHMGKEGEFKWMDYKRMANKLPTVRNFCKKIGIHYDTFYEWVKEYKEFSDTFTHAKDLVKWFLIENGLNNCYNPSFAIFVAKNITDMTDKSIQELTGKDGQPLQFSFKVDLSGGFIPPMGPAHATPETGNPGPSQIQGSSVAQKSTKDDNSNNGVNKAVVV